MLDRRERSGELVEGLLCAQEGHQARLWTSMPGIIQSWNPAERTAVIQPALKALVQQPDGSEAWVGMPLLVDCPVVFPGAGDVVLTFPLKAGDECLVVFASRCIDAWWQSGGVQQQAELRMHDLSDGFCIPGVSSKPRVESDISVTEATLRSRDGSVMVRLNPTTKEVEMRVLDGDGHLAFARVSQNVSQIGAQNSLVKASANRVDITGELWINGKQYLLHNHSGVQPGGGLSGPIGNA